MPRTCSSRRWPRGTLRCIGSTTYKEYRQYFEKDRALVRRFQKIDVNEPSIPDAIEILKGLKPYFEDYHKLKYTNEAIKAAVELSARYIHDRKLPDKAIDVIDESGAAQMLLPESRRKKTIGIKEIETTIATMARIPPKTVSKDDAEVLAASARRRSSAWSTARTRRSRRCRPRSSSPARACASRRSRSAATCSPARPASARPRWPSSSPSALGVELIRFDMSEYMERHTVSRLIGAPPGYVGFDQGGLLTDGVDQHPHCVLLLDEIEKAHPDLFNVLLQIMDHGKLTDHNGKQVDFRNVILIMTTNAGAVRHGQGRPTASPAPSAKATTWRRSTGCSRRNSATGSTPSSPSRICRRRSSPRWSRSSCCSSRRSSPTATSPSSCRRRRADWLIANGYDELMGARPMARVIQEHIKKPLADEVLFGKLKDGGHVRVVRRSRTRSATSKLGFEYPRRPGHAEAGEDAGAAQAAQAPRKRRAGRSRRARRAAAAARRAAARCRRCRWSRCRACRKRITAHVRFSS